jgi:surface protein
MKTFNQYIVEKIKLSSDRFKDGVFEYFPNHKHELMHIVHERIKTEGCDVDLNNIDTSKITSMEGIFAGTNFSGDVSNWDVSNVNNFQSMFEGCKNFNCNLSKWEVTSKATNMSCMFYGCEKFNQNISHWDVSSVKYFNYMFYKCHNFSQDLSKWKLLSTVKYTQMFADCQIDNKYKPAGVN